MVRTEQIGVDVPPGDFTAMAQAIAALADDKELLAAMSAKARAVAARDFDADVVLQRWTQMMRRVAA